MIGGLLTIHTISVDGQHSLPTPSWLARAPRVSISPLPSAHPFHPTNGGPGGGSWDDPTRSARLLWIMPTFGPGKKQRGRQRPKGGLFAHWRFWAWIMKTSEDPDDENTGKAVTATNGADPGMVMSPHITALSLSLSSSLLKSLPLSQCSPVVH